MAKAPTLTLFQSDTNIRHEVIFWCHVLSLYYHCTEGRPVKGLFAWGQRITAVNTKVFWTLTVRRLIQKSRLCKKLRASLLNIKPNIMMHRNSIRGLKLMRSRYNNGQIFNINVAAKFLVSLTDRMPPGLFSCLSYRELTTKREASQAKSLMNAEDYLIKVKTILTVQWTTCCFL